MFGFHHQFRGVQAQSGTRTFPELNTDWCCVCIPVFFLSICSFYEQCYFFDPVIELIYPGNKTIVPLNVFVLSCSWYFILNFFTRENNVCDINPVHYLFATGTREVSCIAYWVWRQLLTEAKKTRVCVCLGGCWAVILLGKFVSILLTNFKDKK